MLFVKFVCAFVSLRVSYACMYVCMLVQARAYVAYCDCLGLFESRKQSIGAKTRDCPILLRQVFELLQ